jgi:UDP-N-acetylmuramoyl-tripeptide--D-alanyl-D-alanine ligase
MLWSAAEAASATGGVTNRNWVADTISIDSRNIEPGALFVALKDQRDGHDFVADAFRKGAVAAMVSRIPDGVAPDAPLLVVDDVLAGLVDLARAARARSAAKVVAVTGSVGKTSTKEMLRVALAGQGRVHAAEKSFNNHWGVPLTLARCPRDAEFMVIEIGMNHPGEIAPLARLAAPDVAVVTTVAAAHLAAFDGLEGIAREKAAIFEGLKPGGTAVLNGDLPTSPILIAGAKASGARIVRFGTDPANEYRLGDVTITPDATVFRASLDGTDALVRLSVPGRHFAMNALAAIAAAEALGADPGMACLDLAGWLPPAGRGTRETVTLDSVVGLEFELIDDAYNANPTSLAASLEVLAATMPKDNVGHIARGRRVAILGDMLELGPQEAELHEELARLPSLGNIHIVHCVGPLMRRLWDALPAGQRGMWFATSAEMAAKAGSLADAGDVVLVKGSLGMALAKIVDALRKMGHRRETSSQGSE